MITITRQINGQELQIELTQAEVEEVRRQDSVQWARDILANYAEMLVDYDSIMEDEEQLKAYADKLEEKNLANNGEREIEAIHELFTVTEDY